MSTETIHYVILPLMARVAIATLLVINAVVWTAAGVI